MSDFLENQKKKAQAQQGQQVPGETEHSSLEEERAELETNQAMEEALVQGDDPDPDLEGPELGDEGDEYDEELADLQDELDEALDRVEKLEKKNEILKEQIAELTGEGGTEEEGWLGPHAANALKEEVQHQKITIVNLNRQNQKLREQSRVGNR